MAKTKEMTLKEVITKSPSLFLGEVTKNKYAMLFAYNASTIIYTSIEKKGSDYNAIVEADSSCYNNDMSIIIELIFGEKPLIKNEKEITKDKITKDCNLLLYDKGFQFMEEEKLRNILTLKSIPNDFEYTKLEKKKCTLSFTPLLRGKDNYVEILRKLSVDYDESLKKFIINGALKDALVTIDHQGDGILVGGKGVGKTKTAEAYCVINDIPYYYMALTSGTLVADLKGSWQPNTNPTRIRISSIAKTFAFLKFLFKSTIEKEQVEEYLNKYYEKEKKAHKDDPDYFKNNEGVEIDAQHFIFVLAPLMICFKYGMAVILDEFNAAAPVVQNFLLGLCNRGAKVALPDGSIISRHPNFRLIATANLGYLGTYPINDAVKDRLRFFDIPNLTKDELIERLMVDDTVIAAGTSKATITAIVDACEAINELLKADNCSWDNGIRKCQQFHEALVDKDVEDKFRALCNAFLTPTQDNDGDVYTNPSSNTVGVLQEHYKDIMATVDSSIDGASNLISFRLPVDTSFDLSAGLGMEE